MFLVGYCRRACSNTSMLHKVFNRYDRSLAKERAWAVHLTCSLNRGWALHPQKSAHHCLRHSSKCVCIRAMSSTSLESPALSSCSCSLSSSWMSLLTTSSSLHQAIGEAVCIFVFTELHKCTPFCLQCTGLRRHEARVLIRPYTGN